MRRCQIQFFNDSLGSGEPELNPLRCNRVRPFEILCLDLDPIKISNDLLLLYIDGHLDLIWRYGERFTVGSKTNFSLDRASALLDIDRYGVDRRQSLYFFGRSLHRNCPRVRRGLANHVTRGGLAGKPHSDRERSLNHGFQAKMNDRRRYSADGHAARHIEIIGAQGKARRTRLSSTKVQ